MIRFITHPAIRLILLLVGLGGLILSLHETTGVKARVSNLMFEAYMKIKPRPSSDQLIFVDIDDQSLSRIGQWPWPRFVLAEMIRNITKAGASVILFDGVLAEPDRTSPSQIAALLPADHPARDSLAQMPDNDSLLADAIKESGIFVAGFSYGSNAQPPKMKGRILAKRDVKSFFLSQTSSGSNYFQTTAQFLPTLQKAAAGNGSFMASLDSDAVIRKTGLFFHNGRQLYPSLILEGARLMNQDSRGYAKLDWNSAYETNPFNPPFLIELNDLTIPVSADGKMWIYYRYFNRDEQIPAFRFVPSLMEQPEALPDLSGKVVFIASEAEGLKDLRATPLGNVAGVKVHMNAFEQILQGHYLNRPAKAIDYEFFTGIGAGLLLIGLSFFINPAWLLIATLSFITAAISGSWLAFDHYGFLLDPVTPSILVSIIFVAASALSFLKTELDRKQVRDAFGLYISPDFMKELTGDPNKLKLGGEIKELTIMFTDIRSFTTISEGLTPEELIALMNDFLTPMSDLVMQNRGTIDKYMGDAMMAFWNAPLDDPDHAINACRAALGMQAALTPINEAIEAKAKGSAKKPVLLKAGIGINTGLSAVGNMGSRQRFAYSTLGDPVNLASRLEGQTKNYGVGILVGEETTKAVPDFAILEMDLIRVKGKTKPVRVFALLGDEILAQNSAFIEQASQHHDMISAYQGGEFKRALKLAKQLYKEDGYDLQVCYQLYIERCEAMIKKPPGDDWDGVFTATTK